MKNSLIKIVTIIIALTVSYIASAQCPAGETEITIEFSDGGYYYYGPLIQWDYIAGGFISGDGPFGANDVVTTCVPDGNLLIVGCDEQYGFGWFAVEFTVTVTEDGSVNGCGAQDGCILYIGDNTNNPYTESCYYGSGSPTDLVAQIAVGPCDASPILTEGCTDPAAPNYNACATTDDGSCLLPTANDNCIDAIPITVEPTGSCPGNSIQINNTGNTQDYTPSCAYNPPIADLFYSFIVPPSGSINIFSNSFGGVAAVTVLDACNGTEYFCDTFVFNESVGNLPVGEELILQVSQNNNPSDIELCVQEAPPPPPSDLCENAIPICGITDGTNFSATSDINDPFSSCIGTLENTVWFSFEADGSGDPITIEILQGDCGYGYYPFPVLQTHIISGPCGGPFTEEDCSNGDFNYYYYYSSQYTLNLVNPVAGVQYYVYIDGSGGSECEFTIEPSGGIQACCGPDFSLSPVCQLGDDSGFYVDIQVNDIGDNPSGYSINGGAFPDITSTGTTTIGPFSNGATTITIEGLDDATCVITREIEFDCACDPLAVTASDDGLICAGEDYEATVVLEDVIPGGFTGVYTVTTDPAGSCSAVPTGAVTEVQLGDDDFSSPIPLGFNFDYWENTYTDFYIGSNGFVTFGSGSTSLFGDPIPTTFPPNNIIALFWGDLFPLGGYYGYPSGIISYYNATVGGQNCMVVEFDDVNYCCSPYTSTVSGQIIMCEDGTIIINCIDCQPNSYFGYYYYYGSATSGIENSDGTAGYFDPALVNGQYSGIDSYTACTTFTPEVTDPSPCTFLYWVTDLNDPAGSIASTDETAILNPTSTTTYYAVVECENAIQCIDEVTVTIDESEDCGTACEDEIAAVVIAPFECDLTGITVVISIINDDGSETIIGSATTDANGNYALPGGPFACGDYSAMLMLPLPDCYSDGGGNAGPVGPINFTVDGDGTADGAIFFVNPEIPTLSQWGLIILSLLMMTFGALHILKPVVFSYD